MICGVDFLLNCPSPGISFFFDMDNALSSIQHTASISLTIFYPLFLNSRLIFYPFHWKFHRSLNTALSCYVQQAGCLLRLSLHHWFFFMLIIMMISNNTLSLYGLVILEDKYHICKVIVAILISTNAPLIPSIWSLAPTSTMSRLRLQRAASESSCPTKH